MVILGSVVDGFRCSQNQVVDKEYMKQRPRTPEPKCVKLLRLIFDISGSDSSSDWNAVL